MKYRKKPVVIEAITFEEFVEYGKTHGGYIVNGMPWEFEYKGWTVTNVRYKRCETLRDYIRDKIILPIANKFRLFKNGIVCDNADECYIIPTLEGKYYFTPDDMLITGVKGEIYPCKKDIFEATYEAIDDEDSEVCCAECKYLMFSDCYGECSKGYKGIVRPNDSCGKGERR